MDVHTVFDCFETELVGRAANITRFDATAGEPCGETMAVVVTTFPESLVGARSRQFDGGSAVAGF